MADVKAVTRKADMLPAPMVGMIQALVPDCATLLPPDISTEQFRAALWLELSGRPALSESLLDDLRQCIVKAATFGLLPGRDCHFLPFRNKQKGGKISATYVPNYQGILRSLYRTGQVEHAFAEVVYTNDTYDLDYGRTPQLIHKPPRKNRGVGEGAYGFIQVKGSRVPLIHYMDPDDIDRVRRKSPAHEQGPWVSDINEMKRKTAMKNVAKYAPLSPLVQQLLAEDDARQETDQPAARYHTNVTDLFDQTSATTSTQGNRAVVVDVETGEIDESHEASATSESNLEAPEGKNAATPVSGWRRVIEQHLLDSDTLRGKIPAELREQCLHAFHAKFATPTFEQEGERLASALLEWVAAQEG